MKDTVSSAMAVSILRTALARHGSHSQCDLSYLLGQLDYKNMTHLAFTVAAYKAAADLVDV